MKAAGKVFSADFANKVISGLLGLILIRHMEPLQFALFTLGLAAAQLSNQILSAGFNRLYLMGVQGLGERSARTSFLVLQISLATLVNLVLLPMLGLPLPVALASLALSLSLSSLEFVKTIFQKDLAFSKFSLIDFIRSVLFAGFISILVFGTEKPVEAWLILATQAAIVGVVILIPLLQVMPKLSWSDWIHAVRLARSILASKYFFIFAYFALIAVFSQVEVFMLKMFGKVEEVAIYGAAFRYYAILTVGLGSLHTVLAPMIQEIKTQEEFKKLMHDYRRLAYVLIGMVVLAMLISGWAIPIIDNGKYPQSVLIFRILACVSVISLLYSPFVHILIRLEKFDFLIKLISATLIADIFGNLVLIHFFGPVGAAISMLVCSSLCNFSIFVRAKKESHQLFQ